MAAPKREHDVESSMDTNGVSKKSKTGQDGSACETFLQWCVEQKLIISGKVGVSFLTKTRVYVSDFLRCERCFKCFAPGPGLGPGPGP